MAVYITILLLLSVIAFVPVFINWRRNRLAESEAGFGVGRVAGIERKAVSSKRRSDYRAASVIPCPNACSAAIAARGNRVLLDQIPRLPLDSCDRIQDCTCTYEQHADRRSGEDRRNQYGSLSTGGQIGQDFTNQRSGMDRRSDVDADLENLEFE